MPECDWNRRRSRACSSARRPNTPAPSRGCISYANVGRPPEFDALCEGDVNFNGFYGYGIVDAFAAVTAPPAWDELP